MYLSLIHILNKLVWKKGQEDACAACHGEKAVGSTPSLQTAVHTKCVWCHETVAQSSRAYLTAQVEAKKDVYKRQVYCSR